MFFQESEAIATENLDLRKTVEQVDHLLATIFTNAPLRPEDFAWKLRSGCKPSHRGFRDTHELWRAPS
jgi:hypothetical protein